MRCRIWSTLFSLTVALTAACADGLSPTAPVRAATAVAHRPAFDVSNFANGNYWETFAIPGAYDTASSIAFDPFGNPLNGLGAQTWALVAPAPWHPTNFDVAMHSRDPGTWVIPESFTAMHGTNCVPYQLGDPSTTLRPGGSHVVATYDDENYRCRNHMMTALKASGYGMIYVTPDAMVDFTSGEASVKFALATLRTSGRDWVDLWITPWDDNLKLPLDASLPDMQGPPRRAIHVRMIPELAAYTKSAFEAYYVYNFNEYRLPVVTSAGYESILTPISTRRDTFELKISQTHVSFGMTKPASPGGFAPASLMWINTMIPPLSFTRGVVQFGHHSFNPALAANPLLPSGTGGTWHWDEFKISPAAPFTIVTPAAGSQRYADSTHATVTFSAPAPAGSYLRFAAYGNGLQVSVDGVNWAPAVRQAEKYNIAGRFHSYWTPIPTGATSVQFRVRSGGRGDDETSPGPWFVRDVTIWSLGGIQSGSSVSGQTWGQVSNQGASQGASQGTSQSGGNEGGS